MSAVDIAAIVPFSGHEKDLQLAIQSIFNQSLQVSELIVIDNSINGLSSLFLNQMNDRKTKIYRTKPRIGAGNARNLGAKESRSEYLAFLDADDVWHPKKIEEQFSIMQEHNYDLSTTDYTLVRRHVRYQFPNLKQGKVEKELYLRSHNGVGSTLLIKKDVFESLGGFDPNLLRYEDWDFMIRSKNQKRNFFHVCQSLCVVRREPNENWSNSKLALEIMFSSHDSLSGIKKWQFKSGVFFEKAVHDAREKKYLNTLLKLFISTSCWPTQFGYVLRMILIKIASRFEALR